MTDDLRTAQTCQMWHDALEIHSREVGDINAHLKHLYQLVTTRSSDAIVELGVRGGVSTIAWLAGLQITGGRLWAIDLNEAPPHVAHAPQCTFVKGDSTSLDVVERVSDEVTSLYSSADIVFIDTNHDYDLTLRELRLWSPLVGHGGVIVLHDTAVEKFPHHSMQRLPPQPPFPVTQAVDKFLIETRGAFRITYETDHCNGLVILTRLT